MAYRTLADYLARAGETQTDLARRVGCSQAVISRVAAGLQAPSFRLALRISKAARVPVASLLPTREQS
jgi:transcriptional regulator with XRE-family HTH domain